MATKKIVPATAKMDPAILKVVAGKAQRAASKAPGPVVAVQAPAAPAAPVAPVLALRGGLAISTVRLTGKVYRVGAPHNQAWWQQCVAGVQAGGGTASVQALVQAGVPAIFVGYVVRRGYMAGA